MDIPRILCRPSASIHIQLTHELPRRYLEEFYIGYTPAKNRVRAGISSLMPLTYLLLDFEKPKSDQPDLLIWISRTPKSAALAADLPTERYQMVIAAGPDVYGRSV